MSACPAAARSTCTWSATSHECAVRVRRARTYRRAGRTRHQSGGRHRQAARALRRPTEGTLGDPTIDEEAARHADELMWAERAERRGDLFIDVTFPPPRLIVFGAVDFAAALCKMAKATGWRAFVVDPRARFAQPARFPDAEEVVAAWPEEAFQRLGGID